MSKYMAKGALRTVKNMTRGYSGMQAKVREATSNDPWGPSGSQMSEIARATFDPHHFQEIMDMIDKRLNDKGKNWRHVFKALTLLDYCLHSGSQNVIVYAKDNFYIVKTLKEFQFIDEKGKDQGANVRQKARDIMSLLSDESRLREERNNRSSMQHRMDGGSNSAISRYGSYPSHSSNFDPDEFAQTDEDQELQRAIEESKRSAAEHEKRLRSSDEDIQKAIELSKQEANEQSNKVSETNELILLNDIPGTPTGANLYQQQQQHDLIGDTNYYSNTNCHELDPFDPLQGNNNTISNGYHSVSGVEHSLQMRDGSNNPFGTPQNTSRSFDDSGFQPQSFTFAQNQTNMYDNNMSSCSISPSSLGYNQYQVQQSPNPFYEQHTLASNTNDPFSSVSGPNSLYDGVQQQQPFSNTLIDFETSLPTPSSTFGNTVSKNPFLSAGNNTWGQSKPSLNDIMRQQQQQSALFISQSGMKGNHNYGSEYGQPFHQQQPYGPNLNSNNSNNPFGF